mmetsp:Transcript_18852/g.22629  ORF Transcript_18852/g.22629 Transcript_18852/m.22629 type:complete len:214 (-) Transcript_18852:129-770(-)
MTVRCAKSRSNFNKRSLCNHAALSLSPVGTLTSSTWKPQNEQKSYPSLTHIILPQNKQFVKGLCLVPKQPQLVVAFPRVGGWGGVTFSGFVDSWGGCAVVVSSSLLLVCGDEVGCRGLGVGVVMEDDDDRTAFAVEGGSFILCFVCFFVGCCLDFVAVPLPPPFPRRSCNLEDRCDFGGGVRLAVVGICLFAVSVFLDSSGGGSAAQESDSPR